MLSQLECMCAGSALGSAPFGESWLCPLFFELTASSGRCLIAQSQSLIGLKPSRRWVLCVQSDQWRAHALVLTVASEPWPTTFLPVTFGVSNGMTGNTSSSSGMAHTLSQSKCAEQNCKAQRAFHERRDQCV